VLFVLESLLAMDTTSLSGMERPSVRLLDDATMDIVRRIKVATGDILIVKGRSGPLECLIVGDYGKERNIKADFLGLPDEPRPNEATIQPLEEKCVVTISTQYGCSIGCKFCDVPKVGVGRNATYEDLLGQVQACLSLHPGLKTKRLNVHFARMGEPTFNLATISAAHALAECKQCLCQGGVFHPVVSTMMPSGNVHLESFVRQFVWLKNWVHGGEAGLQISVNSTDYAERQAMFSGNAHSLGEIGYIMRGIHPVGRKFTLNFAVAGYEIDPDVLLRYFSPDDYIVKLTPMHVTAACVESGIRTDGDYTTLAPYREHEEALKAAGYDVIVFLASRAEDEGRITCGNAILSGTEPFGDGVVPCG
jgi:23S rRNA (adenine2503-C2)-methyltransferase